VQSKGDMADDKTMEISHQEHAAVAVAAPHHHHHEHHATDIELHHDKVDPEAIGGHEQDLPPNYYRYFLCPPTILIFPSKGSPDLTIYVI
jgi:hypothetical protein